MGTPFHRADQLALSLKGWYVDVVYPTSEPASGARGGAAPVVQLDGRIVSGWAAPTDQVDGQTDLIGLTVADCDLGTSGNASVIVPERVLCAALNEVLASPSKHSSVSVTHSQCTVKLSPPEGFSLGAALQRSLWFVTEREEG